MRASSVVKCQSTPVCLALRSCSHAFGCRRDRRPRRERVGRAVVEGRADRGVVCCWTGTGVSMAANKVHGARAALCHDEVFDCAALQRCLEVVGFA